MSKLIDMYHKLKNENKDTFYLFKAGIFYIFLDEYAKKMSKKLELKLTNLNDDYVKCGFPCNSLDKYINKINNSNLKIKIVDSNALYSISTYSYKDSKIQNLLKIILSVDTNNLSIKETYLFIEKLKEIAKDITNIL